MDWVVRAPFCLSEFLVFHFRLWRRCFFQRTSCTSSNWREVLQGRFWLSAFSDTRSPNFRTSGGSRRFLSYRWVALAADGRGGLPILFVFAYRLDRVDRLTSQSRQVRGGGLVGRWVCKISTARTYRGKLSTQTGRNLWWLESASNFIALSCRSFRIVVLTKTHLLLLSGCGELSLGLFPGPVVGPRRGGTRAGCYVSSHGQAYKHPQRSRTPSGERRLRQPVESAVAETCRCLRAGKYTQKYAVQGRGIL